MRDGWSSNFGFLMAAVGSAVGLGTIWRFPYSIGVSGGGLYLLIFLVTVSLVVLPILLAEMAIGRRAALSPPNAMALLAREAGSTERWRWVAIAQFLGAFVVLAFYCVVGGWTLAYLPLSATGAFDGNGPAEVQATFDALNASAPRLAAWHGLFLLLTAAVSFGGVKAGIEKATNLVMPLFFVVLIALAAYAMAIGDAAAAVHFLFAPDMTKLTAQTWLNALGQAFFSIGAGATVYMAYASYAGPTLRIGQAGWVIIASVTLVSILAGLAIFPIVFKYGLSPASGPGLAFVTLPLAFAAMPGGAFFGTVFFVLLFIAAITSSISMLEVTVSWLTEHYAWSRHKAVSVAAAIAWLLGLCAVFSFNVWRDIHPLGWIDYFAQKTFFDLFDFFAANVLLPIGGFCITLFAGWVLSREIMAREIGGSTASSAFRLWSFLIRFVAPLAVLTVLVYSLLS
jgi:neurotransmitter:Na+ symporter, NSS family